MTFHCDRCGICCQHIDLVPQLKEFDPGNGRCIHLQKNNFCGIYSKRPAICNVEQMYELYYKDYFSNEEYFNYNMQGCYELKSKYIE